jgi:hypothetical protein
MLNHKIFNNKNISLSGEGEIEISQDLNSKEKQ